MTAGPEAPDDRLDGQPLLDEEVAGLRERLGALRVDPPDQGFSAALHRRLALAGPPAPAPWWRRLGESLWPTGRAAGARSGLLWPVAVAAALLLALLFPSLVRSGLGPAGSTDPGGAQATPGSVATSGGPAKRAPGATVSLSAAQVAVVRLNLTAEVAVAAAELRVRLPEGLVFWSDGRALADRSLAWTQPLSAGDNDIPIPVRGQRPGTYRVAFTAKVGDDEIQDEVLLEVVDG